jgi:hypothetical protein
VRGAGAVLARRWGAIGKGEPHLLPGRLVVSLTSWPPRFPTLDVCLASLLSQDMAPNHVVLWVALEDRRGLPARVERLQERGLDIRSCEDIRQFKKILPTLEAFPDAFVLICDDDNVYPKGWLRRFVDEYRAPDEVLCQVARRFALDAAGTPLPFTEWPAVPGIARSVASRAVVPVGTGGVLYPPGSLREAVAGDFRRLCPTSDDLWLWWHFAAAGRRARRIRPAGRLVRLPGTQRVALWRTNDVGGGNDRQIEAMIAAYGLPFHRPCGGEVDWGEPRGKEAW